MIDDLLSEINKIQDSTSLKQISLSENERLIFNKAYNLLSRREYSEIELTTKLKQRMPEEDCLIPAVIEKLVNAGYLSNERYKEMIIKKLLKKGIATQNIINELRKHQIDVTSCEIRRHAEDLNINKGQKIQQLILKKARLLNKKPIQKQRESIIRFLLTKGYQYDDIKKSIEEFFKDDY